MHFVQRSELDFSEGPIMIHYIGIDVSKHLFHKILSLGSNQQAHTGLVVN